MTRRLVLAPLGHVERDRARLEHREAGRHRGVLQEGVHDAHQRRRDRPERLRQHDLPEYLRERHAQRTGRLRRILPRHPLLSFSEHRLEHGIRYFKEAEERGLEGIMAKRADSLYHSGTRSADWLKIKTARRQEVVIAASQWGKIKTTVQVVAIAALIVDNPPHTVTTVLVALAVAVTVWSGIEYFVDARDVLRSPA